MTLKSSSKWSLYDKVISVAVSMLSVGIMSMVKEVIDHRVQIATVNTQLVEREKADTVWHVRFDRMEDLVVKSKSLVSAGFHLAVYSPSVGWDIDLSARIVWVTLDRILYKCSGGSFDTVMNIIYEGKRQQYQTQGTDIRLQSTVPRLCVRWSK